MIQKIRDILHWHPYRIPPTSQVDALDTPKQSLFNINNYPNREQEPIKKVVFLLPAQHVDKDSKTWRQLPREIRERTARQKWENAKRKRQRKTRPMNTRELRAVVLDGTVPLGISDTGVNTLYLPVSYCHGQT